MKIFFLLSSLLISGLAMGKADTVIFPQVYNYGFSVQVSVWNYTDRSVNCNGSLFLTYQSGARETEYFFEMVPARFTSYRNINSRRLNDRITQVTHGISCF